MLQRAKEVEALAPPPPPGLEMDSGAPSERLPGATGLEEPALGRTGACVSQRVAAGCISEPPTPGTPILSSLTRPVATLPSELEAFAQRYQTNIEDMLRARLRRAREEAIFNVLNEEDFVTGSLADIGEQQWE